MGDQNSVVVPSTVVGTLNQKLALATDIVARGRKDAHYSGVLSIVVNK